MDKVKTLKGISALGLTALLLAAATATTMAAEESDQSTTSFRGGQMNEMHQEMQDAMESGDYETWSSLMKDSPMAESVSEDLFKAMSEMHELRQSQEEAIESAIDDIEEKYDVELPEKGAGMGVGMGGSKMKMHDGMKGQCPFEDELEDDEAI